MPRYIQASTGQQVDPSIATFSDGRTKPGFHAIVEDGEYVGGFAMMFRDGKPAPVFGEPGRGQMTLDNTRQTDNQADVLARIEAEVAQMRAAHDRKFAFLGDRAPVFDAANAFLVARCKVTDGGKGLENAMRAERSGGSGLATLATDARTEPASTDAQNYDRRALSRARYGV